MGDDVSFWETRERERLFESPIFEVDRVRRRHPDGTEGVFFAMDLPDWVNVVARSDDGQVVLVRQYRHGTDDITLEIPGGNIDDGESPEEAGRRELLEETGWEAESVEVIGTVEPNPAFMGNRCHTILAEGAHPAREPNPDEFEEFEVLTTSTREFHELVRDGEIRHALVVAAAYHLQMYDGSPDREDFREVD